jgi:hypothetical protein
MHNLAGDLARSGKAQEANHRCDILWLGNPASSRVVARPIPDAACDESDLAGEGVLGESGA